MQPLDPLLHNQLRLAIMALLAQNEKVSFTYLVEATNSTRGNLSVQLTTLEQAGYLSIEKTFVGKKPQTNAQLTETGRAAMRAYTLALKDYLNL